MNLTIAAVAVVVACLTSSGADWQPLSLLALLAAYQIASELLVARQGHGEQAPWAVTSAVPITLSMTMLGPAPALLTGLIGLAIDYWRARPPIDDQIANLGNYAAFITTGALLASWVATDLSLNPADPGFAVLVMGVSLYVDFFSTGINLATGAFAYAESSLDQIRRMGGQMLVSAAMGAVFAGATVYAYGAIGLAAAIPLTVALLLHQYLMRSLSISQVRAEELELRAAELGAAKTRLEQQAARLGELSASRGRLVGEVLRAEERERRRLAAALHDEALQDLLVVGQAIERPDGQAFGLAQTAIRRAISQLRGEISDLYPAVLEHAGLRAALEGVTERQATRGGFSGSVEVDPEVCGCQDELLFVLGRELLVNAAKHSGAAKVRISLTRESGSIVMEVTDDGRGMTAEQRRSALLDGRIGLASSVERVEAAGGSIEIESALGAGTRIRTTLPMPAHPPQADADDHSRGSGMPNAPSIAGPRTA